MAAPSKDVLKTYAVVGLGLIFLTLAYFRLFHKKRGGGRGKPGAVSVHSMISPGTLRVPDIRSRKAEAAETNKAGPTVVLRDIFSPPLPVEPEEPVDDSGDENGGRGRERPSRWLLMPSAAQRPTRQGHCPLPPCPLVTDHCSLPAAPYSSMPFGPASSASHHDGFFVARRAMDLAVICLPRALTPLTATSEG